MTFVGVRMTSDIDKIHGDEEFKECFCGLASCICLKLEKLREMLQDNIDELSNDTDNSGVIKQDYER